MMSMIIRKAVPTDIDRLMQIFAIAREFMKSSGNPNQWINGYPQEELIKNEIEQGHCFVCVNNDDGMVVATFCLIQGPDPTYSYMQHLLEKNGFVRCGIIYVANGTPRIAYQRNIRNK